VTVKIRQRSNLQWEIVVGGKAIGTPYSTQGEAKEAAQALYPEIVVECVSWTPPEETFKGI
jgi:hypothetical protein